MAHRVLLVLGGAALLDLMLLGAINVVSRMFGAPFSGTYELVGLLGALSVAFALGEAQRRKDHVLVELFTRGFPAWLLRLLDGFQYLASMAFFSAVAFGIFHLAETLRRSNEVTETLKFPYYPVVYMVAFGFAMFVLVLAADLVALCLRREAPPQ